MTKMFWQTAAAAVMAVSTMTGAQAQDLATRDKIAADKVQVQDVAKRVNAACGTHIVFAVDYASYNGKTPAAGVRQQGYWAYIANAADAITNICVTEAGKAAVQQKIQKVVSKYADGEAESLAGGVFTYEVGFQGGSVDHPEKFLKSHL